MSLLFGLRFVRPGAPKRNLPEQKVHVGSRDIGGLALPPGRDDMDFDHSGDISDAVFSLLRHMLGKVALSEISHRRCRKAILPDCKTSVNVALEPFRFIARGGDRPGRAIADENAVALALK